MPLAGVRSRTRRAGDDGRLETESGRPVAGGVQEQASGGARAPPLRGPKSLAVATGGRGGEASKTVVTGAPGTDAAAGTPGGARGPAAAETGGTHPSP